jgi:hypothetical protein
MNFVRCFSGACDFGTPVCRLESQAITALLSRRTAPPSIAMMRRESAARLS